MTFENVSKAATHAVEALRSTPVAIALIAVNALFLVAAVLVLRDVASNARARSETEAKLFQQVIGACGIKL
jgi:hypothetical protein